VGARAADPDAASGANSNPVTRRHADLAETAPCHGKLNANICFCLRPVCVADGLSHGTNYTSVCPVTQTAPGVVSRGADAQILLFVCVPSALRAD